MKQIEFSLQRSIKILFIFWVLLLNFYKQVHADTEINIEVSKTNIDISEIITLQIQVSQNTLWAVSWEIFIPWLEDFHVINKRQSQSNIIVNGKQTRDIELILNLKAKNSWNFLLWPINYWGSESNTLSIEVTGTELFIGGQADNNLKDVVPSQDSFEQEEKIKSKKEQDILNSFWKSTIQKSFHDIMPNTSSKLLDLQKSVSIILLLLLLYIGLKIYKKIIPIIEKNTKKNTHEIPVITTDYNSLLESVKNNFIHANKDIFYGKIWEITRRYMDEKIEPGLSTKTFQELQIKIESFPNFAKIYEKIYFPEYNTSPDTVEDRLEIINTLKNELL